MYILNSILVFCILVLELFVRYSICQYDRNNAAMGIKLSANEQLLVTGSNAFFNFGVVFNPFNNSQMEPRKQCNIRYLSTDHFVHSIAVVGATNNGTNREMFMFAYSGEITTTAIPFICFVTVARSICAAQHQITFVHEANKSQNYFLIGVDSYGSFVYGFTDTIIFKLEIATNKFVKNLTLESFWPAVTFLPHALDLSDTWAVVVGYGYKRNQKKNYVVMECLIDLIALINLSCETLTVENTYLVPSNLISYNELYEVSVAIRGEKVLIGIHRLNRIIELKKKHTLLEIIREHTVTSSSLTSFGRLVEWVDERTIVVVAYHNMQTTWSKSQLFFYNENSISPTSPLYTFPNNQQIIGKQLLRPQFVRLVMTDNGNLALLTDLSHVLIVPVSPPNYAAVWNETSTRAFVFHYLPKPCIGGTFKNESGLGPCTICLPGTRNPALDYTKRTSCIPCSHNRSNSYCSLGSLVEFDFNTTRSYSQVTAYPESPTTTSFDDILLENVFEINTSFSCLFIAPLFWTSVAGAVAFYIWLVMTIIKLCKWQQYESYRVYVKTIFRNTDLISEGERWVGGLATMAIIALVSFAYWFSASFLHRYPIESITGPSNFACDPTLINAKFSTGLDLLSIPKSVDAQRIITLLDEQTFEMTIELINTGFSCNNITVQENLLGKNYIQLPMSCNRSEWNAVTSIVFFVPHHYSYLQLNMTGPHWVNAVRLCVRGESQTKMSSTLRALDFCQLFSTSNQTLAHASSIPITLTKIINMTKSMDDSHPATYSGLWLASFGGTILSEEAFYVEFGDYLRYTFAITSMKIKLEERSFYIKNIQEPIVRPRQTVFQSLLFTSLVIELFGFSFLLFKLFIAPFIRRLLNMRQKRRSRCQAHQDNVALECTPASRRSHIGSIHVNMNTDR